MSLEMLKKQAVAPVDRESTGGAPRLCVAAVLSMLHERAGVNSATRLFLGHKVLRLTADRVRSVRDDIEVAIAYWDDQSEAVEAAMGGLEFTRLRLGGRTVVAGAEGVWAAGRWTDGWRSGPGDVSSFDRGWHAGAAEAAIRTCGAGAVMVMDASAGLVDPNLLRGLIEQAEHHEDRGLVFLPAAPGFGAMIIRASVVEELKRTGGHPGKALHYVPDYYAFDPIGTPAAAPVPTAVARSNRQFTLDTPGQVELLSGVTGVLEKSAEEIVRAVTVGAGPYPRDLRLELTTHRATKPVFVPSVAARSEMRPAEYARLFDELGSISPGDWCPVRVTLGGVGDAMLYEGLEEVAGMAAERGVALAVETDLMGCSPERVEWLALGSAVDVVMVHLPAASREVYARVMGADAHEEALSNMTRFLRARARGKSRNTPLLIPIFTKLRENASEMEVWYDHYLRELGTAVVEGPAFVPALGVAEMAPPNRKPCRRLWSRATLLADGTWVPCELHATNPGSWSRNVQEMTLSEFWASGMENLREAHRAGRYSLNVLCGECREWHRP